MKPWEDKYVARTKEKQTLNGLIRYYYDKWGAMLYVKNTLTREKQSLYIDEKDYLDAIAHLLKKKNKED